MTWREVAAIQSEYKETFQRPEYQRRFSQIAKKCYPDMFKYQLAIEPLCDEAQGRILKKHGLIRDATSEGVDEANTKLHGIVMRYWSQAPELRNLVQGLSHVTLQDSRWP